METAVNNTHDGNFWEFQNFQGIENPTQNVDAIRLSKIEFGGAVVSRKLKEIRATMPTVASEPCVKVEWEFLWGG